MAADGCSGGMDALARWINKYIRRAGDNRPLAFTGCCDEHDLFYEQGTPWQGWGKFLPWLWGRITDLPWRWKADKLLRECIAANLKKRGCSKWGPPARPLVHLARCAPLRLAVMGHGMTVFPKETTMRCNLCGRVITCGGSERIPRRHPRLTARPQTLK